MNSSRPKLLIITLAIVMLVFPALGQQADTSASTPQAPTPSQQETAPTEGQALHVLVGKSVVINVQSPMTRVLSSNPAAVETLATSPTQVVVEGKAAGNGSLILWDQNGHSQMLDVVVDVDVTGLRTAIERAYPNQHIEVQADGGRLILSGVVTDAHAVEDLTKMASLYSPTVVNSLTVAASHDPQVLLEVRF